jgi:hypothetical protein
LKEGRFVNRVPVALIGLVLLLCLSCRFAARSDRSFDQICDLVSGKTAHEVEVLLGAPDLRREVLPGDERWIWWNYTFLDGDSYPPEMRGQVVHLEISLTAPPDASEPHLLHPELRVDSPLAVSYSLPVSKI